jgi:hypothetical protein
MDVEGSELAILRSLSPAHISAMDSLAMEVHPQAYSVQELLALLSTWGTHQISFNEQDEFSAPIVRLASMQTLLAESSKGPA